MPLGKPISELRKELRDLVTNGQLPEALRYCNELLPENTEKYDLVLQMRANLKQLNQEITQNLISQDERGRRIAQISAAFLNLVSNLEEADFELPQVSKSKSKNDTQRGSVLYHIPHSMPMNKASYCKVRVAIEKDAILEDIIIDGDVRIRERVEVSERMSAELVDTEGRVFDILPLNAKDQTIRPTGYTQWLFRVTPLVEGEHQLMVKVSLLAFDPNTKEYVPRDVSVLETVTVVTASQQSDEEETAFKPTGHSFALGPSTGEVTQPEDTNKGGNVTTFPFSIRTMSFFLTFLVFAYSVGYSIARPLDTKLFVASIQGKEALVQFVAENKDEVPGGLKNSVIETAYFRIAKKSGELADLREYQELYTEKGKFGKDVLQKIATLEWKAVESIQQKPSLLSIQNYLRDFPDATRLPQVLDAAQAIPAAEQAQVLPKIEEAYVQSMELQPSARKIEQYSQDFPDLGKLNALAQIAVDNPEVLPQVRPVLERVVLQKVKTAENAEQVRALLPSLKIAAKDREEVLEKVEKVATLNDPALGRALQADLRALQIENAEKIRREEEEKRLAAEKAREDSLNRVAARKAAVLKAREDSIRLAEQKAAEAKRQKEAEQAKKDQEAKDAADKAEQERLKKEAAAKAEQERKDKEAADKAASTPDNSIPRPTMVSVKGGTFEMGDVMGDKEYDNEKVHSVTVSDFMISKTEVTFEEYDRFCAATKKDKPDDEKWGRGKYPVINVSWEDAIAYCNWLSEKHGLQPVYSGQGNNTTANWSSNGYRLPTEAEWEYAARGGGKKIRFGNDKDVADPKEINFDGTSGKKTYSISGEYRERTVPVGSLKSPNALGLHDMSGNVYEWCWDWYDKDYYNISSAKDPKGPSSGGYRVLRGGSWYYGPDGCRADVRGNDGPTFRNINYGFRLVRH